MTETSQILSEMNARSREVFRHVVEAYLASGEPVGSRTLSRSLPEQVSPATIRNVMQDLEYLGLLGSPHISAGRVPTQLGLRLFVDGLLEVTELSASERATIDASLEEGEHSIPALLDRVGAVLSGLTQGASLVMAPKYQAPIRHVEFVSLSPDRALVVLVTADGHVENRLFTPPPGQTPADMRAAANFINAFAAGRTLPELREIMTREITARRQELDTLARALVEGGLAVWENAGQPHERLIVRGRANLLEDGRSAQDIDRVRELFDELERKRDIARFLDLTEAGEGVRVFIGSENKLFSLTGSSVVVSPYMNADRRIIGAVGVIGPTRLNYARIVPIVDYTARVVGQLLGERG